MPFGKYEGNYLIDLPEYYVVWYRNKGFPKGQLGEQLKLVYELKTKWFRRTNSKHSEETFAKPDLRQIKL